MGIFKILFSVCIEVWYMCLHLITYVVDTGCLPPQLFFSVSAGDSNLGKHQTLYLLRHLILNLPPIVKIETIATSV